ncbi:helix-turn-helix domain-containing protein [Paracoccus sp. JM45]|uniref:helix-turn-helix domain-containing protein n=1 Tax=Paracoccus sp. JM45 TaxID=2283626 RepID=UPI000E6D2958|nr:helix-turn-helix domain-containing protein [Paracoccus sp. JM45]RJE79114.1 helix-turn-helix domain-containing protein [Paracoccus sp. JM45]
MTPLDQAPTLMRHASTVEEQSALLAGWNQHYCQLSRGAFSGMLCQSTLPDAYLFREKTNRSLLQSGIVGAEVLAVGLPLAITGPAKFCGSACTDHQLHVFSGGEGFEFHTPSGLDIVGLVIPRATLFRHLDDEDAEFVTLRLRQAHLMDISPELFQNLARGMLDIMGNRGSITDVMSLLADAFLTNNPVAPPTLHRNLVAQLRDIATDETWDQPPSIPQICAALGVSRRTLQYALQKELGMSPVEYMRALRLNAARTCILQGASVTEAATRSGFWHFGRFAQDYRILFHERPSATRSKV